MFTVQALSTSIETYCYICQALVHRPTVLDEPAICAKCDTAARNLGLGGDCLRLAAPLQLAILRRRLALTERRLRVQG